MIRSGLLGKIFQRTMAFMHVPRPIHSKVVLSEHDRTIINRVESILPKSDGSNHKGQHGRIGVIGGSLEYTGAPYFAGISALRVGADLVHVFCAKEAAQAIKCYSPDLIVHPLLDSPTAVQDISRWLERLHVIVIGPGLGLDPVVLENVRQLLLCEEMRNKPLVIDADGLKLADFIASDAQHLKGIMTPNAIEAQRGHFDNPNFVVMRKGAVDVISGGHRGTEFIGTGRRCGGQGDLLSGAIAVMYHWALARAVANPEVVACQGASLLIRICNFRAFEEHARGALASDMIKHIPYEFADLFEQWKCQ